MANRASQVALVVKTCLPRQEMQATWVQLLSQEDPTSHLSHLEMIPWLQLEGPVDLFFDLGNCQ